MGRDLLASALPAIAVACVLLLAFDAGGRAGLPALVVGVVAFVAAAAFTVVCALSARARQ
jgi:hypothetical protein